jgi:hypothetical protein
MLERRDEECIVSRALETTPYAYKHKQWTCPLPPPQPQAPSAPSHPTPQHPSPMPPPPTTPAPSHPTPPYPHPPGFVGRTATATEGRLEKQLKSKAEGKVCSRAESAATLPELIAGASSVLFPRSNSLTNGGRGGGQGCRRVEVGGKGQVVRGKGAGGGGRGAREQGCKGVDAGQGGSRSFTQGERYYTARQVVGSVWVKCTCK